MDIIQQIAVEMVEGIRKKIEEKGLEKIGEAAGEIFQQCKETALRIITEVLGEADRGLVEGAKAVRRSEGISIKEKAIPRTITTRLGTLTYRRTYFRLKDGKYIYLLDHIIGVEGYERISREEVASLLHKASGMSYQQAVDMDGNGISRQTVHDRLLSTEDQTTAAERVKQTPDTLDLFADEDHVHLRPKGCGIVPLVTITEGIDASNPKRHCTKSPVHISGYGMENAAFCENVLAFLTEKYDLSEVKSIRLHCDGGTWIKGLANILPQCTVVMDGFHLTKYLKSFLRLPEAGCYSKALSDAIKKNEFEKVRDYCTAVYNKQQDDKVRKKVMDFLGYCSDHWASIVARAKNEYCGSCTEPLVSHVLSHRLSRYPISWSKKGLQKMVMLRTLTCNGEQLKPENIHAHTATDNHFREDGYKLYSQYAQKQADEVLNYKFDWSIFDHPSLNRGKSDPANILLRALGHLYPLGS